MAALVAGLVLMTGVCSSIVGALVPSLALRSLRDLGAGRQCRPLLIEGERVFPKRQDLLV